jgi:NitT/TauT family transport system substrate-binding protein
VTVFRYFLAALATISLLAMPARGAEPDKLRVSIIPINDVAPLFVAINNGYFREEGLQLEISSSAGGAVTIPGLIAGSFDIAYSNIVSALIARDRGLDVKVIAPGTQIGDPLTDTTPLIVDHDSKIRTGADLEGKNVAVNTRNNVIWLYTRAWIKATGGNPDRVNYKEVPFPQMEDALRQKRVDAAMFPAPFSVLALKQGLVEIGKPYTQVQPGVYNGQYLATGKLVSEKPDLINRFARALRRGAEWFNANQKSDLLLKIIADYSKTDENVLKSLPALQTAPLHENLDQIRKTMSFMIEHKLIEKPIDLSPAIAPSAL